MARFVARPVEVDAFEIIDVGPLLGEGSRHLAIEDGSNVLADAGMLARMNPAVGDYWVIQEDGYKYVNPKVVFERKYRPKIEA